MIRPTEERCGKLRHAVSLPETVVKNAMPDPSGTRVAFDRIGAI
jgi:hypothetical protein